jgi:hypothetical protein
MNPTAANTRNESDLFEEGESTVSLLRNVSFHHVNRGRFRNLGGSRRRFAVGMTTPQRREPRH